MGRIVVLALGGNALINVGQAGTYEELEANATSMARSVSSLMRTGWEVVIVHGNGPQVGNLALQQEEGSDLVPPQPLFALGAMTQGQIGSLLCLALRKVMGQRAQRIVAIVTHAEVDPADAAFDNPTKPIGPFLDPAEAEAFAATRGWAVKEDAGRGWRRVVPSPEPVAILEGPAIRALLESGFVVIASGGGGIPVVASAPGPGSGVSPETSTYRGIDAVIDKDYAAQRLASSLEAQALVLVTSVESVLLDYGTPSQRAIEEMSLEDAEQHLAGGQFPEGSMAPKIRAATRFLRAGGEVAVITTPALVYASLEGTVSQLEGRPGTRIVRMRATGEH